MLTRLHKLETFVPFLGLVIVWSLFFATFKFFLWNDLQASIHIDLQSVAAYLSLGSAISYLVGGAFASTFLKKYFLITLSFFLFFTVVYITLFPLGNYIIFAVFTTLVGFLYGLWTVMRNILTATEIGKTGFSDTLVNALVGILFIVSIIGGSILGSIIFEKIGKSGYFVLLSFIFLSFCFSFFMDYEKVSFNSLIKNGWKKYVLEKKKKIKETMKNYLPQMFSISTSYFPLIASSAILWATSSAVSQQAIEYSIQHFGKLPSEATFILLYSAFGVILGNLISVKLQKKRWFYFLLFNLAYASLIITFPFIAEKAYLYTIILAFLIGIFFGISANLVDAFYLKEIGENNQKEYGSAIYGMYLSVTIFFTMLGVSFLNSYLSFTFSMFVLAFLVLIATIIMYRSIYLHKKFVGK